MWRSLCWLTLTVCVNATRPAYSQEPVPKTAEPVSHNFFSGTITIANPDSITVVRKGLGKDSVTRTFIVDSATTIEGRLRVKAKVTVRFAAGENGDRAVHIIVR